MGESSASYLKYLLYLALAEQGVACFPCSPPRPLMRKKKKVKQSLTFCNFLRQGEAPRESPQYRNLWFSAHTYRVPHHGRHPQPSPVLPEPDGAAGKAVGDPGAVQLPRSPAASLLVRHQGHPGAAAGKEGPGPSPPSPPAAPAERPAPQPGDGAASAAGEPAALSGCPRRAAGMGPELRGLQSAPAAQPRRGRRRSCPRGRPCDAAGWEGLCLRPPPALRGGKASRCFLQEAGAVQKVRDALWDAACCPRSLPVLHGCGFRFRGGWKSLQRRGEARQLPAPLPAR